MKITVAMDSFKGSMSSLEAGNAVRFGIKSVHPDAEVEVFPMADGGEGTVIALTHAVKTKENGGIINRELTVTGPLGDKVRASYVIMSWNIVSTEQAFQKQRRTAVIELASAAGLPLVPEDRRNPLYTTTFGVGELIRDAIEQGCRHFIIGIGGSATNDGGIGMLQALGYRFVDAAGEDVCYGAKGLASVADIYFENVMQELASCSFRVACDVKNPLVGENGCSAVFAPQKGATRELVCDMERSMNRYANLVEHIAECDMGELHGGANRNDAGSGAAGGVGYAFLMFLNATLESGVDIVLDEIGLEEQIIDSDYVITGEGRLDSQTIMGKAAAGVAHLAKRHNKPVIAFAGLVASGAEICKEQGLIDEYFQVERGDMSLAEAMKKENAINNLELTVGKIAERVIRNKCRTP